MKRQDTVPSLARFLRELYSVLRRPLSLDEARTTVRRQLSERDERWLHSLEHNVYANRSSPYLPLLAKADCELGDLREAVAKNGLEPTLNALREAGVYVSMEEFKGRRPIVREDLVIHPRPEDFDNPSMGGGILGSTGGTTGPSTPVALTVSRIAARAVGKLLAHHAHGVLDTRMAVWRQFGYPGLIHVLTDAAIGLPDEHWFAPLRAVGRTRAISGWMGHRLIQAVAKAAGTSVPVPEWVDQSEVGSVARWAAECNRPAFLATGVSQALRLAAASREQGLDVSGLTAFVSGESPTPAKVSAIREAGIRLLPHYSITEAGMVAIGCAAPCGDTDMHLMTNLFAMTQQPKEIRGTGVTVEPFTLTSLDARSVKILLNVESDDYGTIREHSCGCPLQEAGLRSHVSDVFSFGKLTGEGVSLVGTDVQEILESVLPRRLGGTPLDYQLAEEEDARGYTRVVLVVSPRVAHGDAEILDAFLTALGAGPLADDVRSIWRGAGTMLVRRAEPIATAAGKVLPLVPKRISDVRRGGRPD
jgi:hypothetical protein